MTLSSLKRTGELQALSINPFCMDFGPGLVKVLEAFSLHYSGTGSDVSLTGLCLVMVINIYVERTVQWCRSDQLFLCSGG